MFMESWILRVSCKVNMKPFWLHINFARDPKYSWLYEHSKNWIDFLILYLQWHVSNSTIAIHKPMRSKFMGWLNFIVIVYLSMSEQPLKQVKLEN